MAAANLIARFESKIDGQTAKIDAQNARFESKIDGQTAKIDAQNARFESKIDAQNAKLDAQNLNLKMLMWMIGAAVAVIGTLIRLWG